ncbi:MAG: DNA recombination protein RmuC [Proteobacteria bacterium]|nr:DNA recombination protein RmuC [Pseudomonadota bacterium]
MEVLLVSQLVLAFASLGILIYLLLRSRNNPLREDLATARREGLEAARDSRQELALRLDAIRAQIAGDAALSRRETSATLGELRSQLDAIRIQVAGDAQNSRQESSTRMGELRLTVERQLAAMQNDNSQKLEKMRQTVEEKLEGTLERRLGASFKHVSDRLEEVHRGLGEMQTLAVGVGDLKRVMANVKTRGIWGEIQLGALLEQILSPEQFSTNVLTKKDGTGRVEFAIKMPGRDGQESGFIWLPIDAKFPMDTYHRLVDAQDRADGEACEQAFRQLESFIKQSAKDISEKYVGPPETTDFAIMYLPTEGLFAEVARRPALVEVIQRDHRVIIAGPTTLAALLNSLQMGFRTLAIQQRSSQVWGILGAVKAEFSTFADTLDKVQKKLDEAGKSIGAAQTRTRVISRKLKKVEDHAPASESGNSPLGLEGASRESGLPSETLTD